MFVYRAIMEMAQFGDTEIEASKMKAEWLKLTTGDGAKRLEEEFERLANNVEDKKAVSVGQVGTKLFSSMLSRSFLLI